MEGDWHTNPSDLNGVAKKARWLERTACAELVRAAGCVCDALMDNRAEREGIPSFKPPFSRVIVHDPRCPEALADAIEARGKE